MRTDNDKVKPIMLLVTGNHEPLPHAAFNRIALACLVHPTVKDRHSARLYLQVHNVLSVLPCSATTRAVPLRTPCRMRPQTGEIHQILYGSEFELDIDVFKHVITTFICSSHQRFHGLLTTTGS